MRRILVAQSIGLWIRLNRHLSGVGAVDLVETPTLEGGQLLAQLERPAIVVFGEEASREEVERLAADLERQGCTDTRLVLVTSREVATPRPPETSDRIVVCPPDDLVPVVTELLALDERSDETLDLLVHYTCETPSESSPAEGFVIVLDMDEKSLFFQADHPFEIETDLGLSFFLSGATDEAPRERVALSCTIESGDARDLMYRARITSLREPASQALRRFLGRDRS